MAWRIQLLLGDRPDRDCHGPRTTAVPALWLLVGNTAPKHKGEMAAPRPQTTRVKEQAAVPAGAASLSHAGVHRHLLLQLVGRPRNGAPHDLGRRLSHAAADLVRDVLLARGHARRRRNGQLPLCPLDQAPSWNQRRRAAGYGASRLLRWRAAGARGQTQQRRTGTALNQRRRPRVPGAEELGPAGGARSEGQSASD
jgi:hypothetical protein